MNFADPSLTDLVAIISAFGVIGALAFTGITIRRDQQSRHYQMFMDLQKERDDIQKQFPEIRDLLLLNETDLKKHPEERQVKCRMYKWEYIQFHDKVAHLALTGVIPKSIPKYFEDTFPSALVFIDLAPHAEVVKEYTKYLQEWCKKEKITAFDDPERKKKSL